MLPLHPSRWSAPFPAVHPGTPGREALDAGDKPEMAPPGEYRYGWVKDTCKIALMALRGNGLTFVAKAEKTKSQASKGSSLH